MIISSKFLTARVTKFTQRTAKALDLSPFIFNEATLVSFPLEIVSMLQLFFTYEKYKYPVPRADYRITKVAKI
jgi:hypothetical protein